ncbi:hypothetical protein ACN9MN_06595 [Chryseobacterium sp. S-02]|uniref:hypothetical protein n=1 Tax=Chryseobacterium sp. S-02 TaxID=3404064 RepID=UPI003CF34C85
MADKGYIIIEGATAYCSSSVTNNSNGTAVPMEVKSQKKKLGKNKYFAQSKPVATYLDDKAESFGGGNGFGNCKGSDGKTYPCKGKCNIKYKDYYENVEFNKSMKILLDVSTGNCPGYGVPGTIAFATTGQANNVSQIDVKETDEFSVANTSPQWSTSSASASTTSVASVSMTLPFSVSKPSGIYYYIQMTGGIFNSFMNPIAIDNLSLTAQFKGDSTKIIWALFKGDGTKDKIKTFIGLGSIFNQSMSKIFSGLEEGKYRIEAYGKKPGDNNCSIIIEVVKDFVKKIVAPGTSTLVNIPFPLSVELKLNTSADQLKILNRNVFNPIVTAAQWKVKQGTTVLYNSSTGVSASHLVGVSNIAGKVLLTFKNAGTYTIEAFTDPTDPKPESIQVKIENSLGVMGVTGEAGLLRYSDMLKVKASRFNVNYMPAATSVYWYLKKDGTGRIVAFESSPSFKTGAINKKVSELLYNDAHLDNSQYFGKYTLEAYANPLGSGKAPAFSGSDCFNFEVIKNVVDKFTLPAGNIPKGTKVKYTATARIAALAGNEAIKVEVPQNVTDNGDATLTFNELGEYTISAYLTGDYTDNKKIEAKIKVSEPSVKRALWAYGTGVKRTETGFAEETYGFLEIDGLQNQALKVKIWVKGEGDDFYKEKDKYMLEEKSVTLNNEGKASFMITTNDDYKKKMEAAIPKTTENPSPSYRLIFTVELQSSSSTEVVLPSAISIQGTRPVVVDGTTTYLEVLDSNEELIITSEQKIVSIMFSTEDGKDIQRMQTFYGKTHKLWVHTVNMTEETLKIDVLKEIPKEGMNENDHIIYTHESKQSYNEEKTGKDGLLEVSFTPKEEWKNPPKNFDYYIAQVSRQVQDPADPKKKVWKIEKSQFTINSTLPADIVRTEDMEKLGIKAYKKDGTPFTKEEMLELRKQFIFYESGCLKVSQKETPETIDNDVMPVVVEMAEVKKEGENGCPRCKAEITVDIIKKVYKNAKDKDIQELALTLNKYRNIFELNTCARKAHFFAQSLQEAGTNLKGGLHGESLDYAAEDLPKHFKNFRANPELGKQSPPNDLAYEYGRSSKNGYKSNEKKIAEIAYKGRLGNESVDDTWNFRGRGLLQITGKGNYKDIQKKIDEKASDSGVMIADGVDKDYTPTEAAITGMADWYKDSMYLKADDTGKSADDVVVDSIVDILNKLTPSRLHRKIWYRGGKLDNWEVKASDSMKMVFKVEECGKGTGLNLVGDAPWFQVAWKEYEKYKGLREIDSPLKEKITEYFDVSSAAGLGYDYTNPWCGAFLAWCFDQTQDYKRINTPKSAAAFGWKATAWDNGEDCEAFVGALIVFDFSHVALIAGENLDGTRYVYLGGNQGNGEKTAGYQKIILGSVAKNSKTIVAITKPKKYTVSEKDKELPKYDVNAENSKESSR